MKISQMILIGATLPFALFGDGSSKPSVEEEADAKKLHSATCGGCHRAHREKAADGSWEIK
jgi:nitrate/TMAO reductase-like tetraheme cytochrome c subunit